MRPGPGRKDRWFCNENADRCENKEHAMIPWGSRHEISADAGQKLKEQRRMGQKIHPSLLFVEFFRTPFSSKGSCW